MTDQPNIGRPISGSIKYDFIFRSADHTLLMQSTMPLMTEASLMTEARSSVA
jgi:hypothetical protein